jgi:hypothetical protein
MREARPADARGKVPQMRQARNCRCARQGWAREGRADARGKAGQIREARPGRCARQVRADERSKARQMRDGRQFR